MLLLQVPGALPRRPASEGPSVVPEAPEVLCAQCSETQATQSTEEEVNTRPTIPLEWSCSQLI